ncbi:hypothetical protein CRE_25754 [Caenorhabditis remanei]|uniref:Uncharacterized protein n=1 Tax=Caenorhabditis remanei TaxID=31234 RepID=E3N5M8_CAERE|nr:hypothetical protein CRE_25754 [Caenorhabditis remanei]
MLLKRICNEFRYRCSEQMDIIFPGLCVMFLLCLLISRLLPGYCRSLFRIQFFRMIILKFPLLIQEQIYKSMDIEDKLALSFCSKRTKESIKIFKFDVKEVVFSFKEKHIGIQFNNKNEFIFPLDPGASFICSFEENKNRVYEFHFNRKEKGLEFYLELHNHIIDLFSKSINWKLTVSMEEINNYRQLPSVRSAKLINVRDKIITDFVSCNPDLTKLSIVGDQNIYFTEMGLINIRNVEFIVTKRSCTQYLKYFRATNAVFFSSTSPIEVALFIRDWFNNVYSENLRFVRILQTRTYERFPNNLLYGYEMKEWDQSRMPKKFPFSKEDQEDLHLNEELFSCDGAKYFEGPNGKLASIRFDSKQFLFYVWDKQDVFASKEDL